MLTEEHKNKHMGAALTILEHYHQEGNNSVMEMLRNNFMNQQT
jgi:hypothetical protein